MTTDRWGINLALEMELAYIMRDNACGRKQALAIYKHETRVKVEDRPTPTQSYRFLGRR